MEMSVLQTVFRFLDVAVIKTLGIGDGREESKYVTRRRRVNAIHHILHDMSIIDSKSSALLTHVSIMIAVVAVLLASLEPYTGLVWRIALIVELVAFSAVTTLLLRCVDIMGPPFRQPPADRGQRNITYKEEILIRRGIYQLMVRIVFLLTFLLIVLAKFSGSWRLGEPESQFIAPGGV